MLSTTKPWTAAKPGFAAGVWAAAGTRALMLRATPAAERRVADWNDRIRTRFIAGVRGRVGVQVTTAFIHPPPTPVPPATHAGRQPRTASLVVA